MLNLRRGYEIRRRSDRSRRSRCWAAPTRGGHGPPRVPPGRVLGLRGREPRGIGDAAIDRRAPAATARAKSMILVFATGGMSHLDTFDLKPDAPEGIRGEFKPIATNVPGIVVGEHLPRLAKRMDRLAVVRTMSHDQTNHLNATHRLLTGQGQPGAFFDKIASRDDYPCYASGLDYVRPRSDGIPTGVTLPTYLMEGPLTWPGQTRRLPRPEARPLADQAGPEQAGLPRGQPRASRRLHRRAARPPPEPPRPARGRRPPAAPSTPSASRRCRCSSPARSRAPSS